MNKLCRLLSNPFLVQLKHGLAKGGQTQVFFNGKYPFSIGKMKFSLSFFRLLWRSIFVVLVTILGMTMPFSNERLTLLGSTGFYPLTIYFPVEMDIAKRRSKEEQ